MRSLFRSLLLAGAMVASLSSTALGQSVPLISQPFSQSAIGPGPVLPLSGQSSCAVSLYNAGSGLTLIPQASSDNGATWTTVSTIGGGSISGLGNFVGNIAGTGLTSFRFLVTGLSSGTVSGNEVCSGAIGPAALTGSTVTAIQPTASLLNATVVGAGAAGTPSGGVVSVQGVAGGTGVPVTGTFFQALQPVSCSAGSVCPTNATLQAGSANAGGFELFDSAGTNKASINLPGAQLVAQGKTRFILTSGSATACTNLQATAGTLVTIINAGSATAVFPAWYDDAGATCATGARLYGNFTSLTLQAGQVVNLNAPLTAGLAYKLSGSLSDNLIVVTQ